jgi:RNA polymerase sigma-70 factor (ECF subfamily)
MTPLLSKHPKVSRLGIDADSELRTGFTKLLPFLRNFARGLSRNRELGEDLVQETLAKAWKARRSFRAGSNLKAWLFTILRNEFYSHQRRAWRQAPWDDELENRVPAPDSEKHWATELSDLARALNSLSEIHRKALILVGVGGFSYAEAAAMTNCALGTVKSRVGRARQSLRETLNNRLPVAARSCTPKGGTIDRLLTELAVATHKPGRQRLESDHAQ